MSTDLAKLAADRYEIADVLHRFAFGLDQRRCRLAGIDADRRPPK